MSRENHVSNVLNLFLSVGIERVVCLKGQYLNNGVFLLNIKNRDGKNVVIERYK
jgi:hypothetical protein